jgi:hypothetical protein
LRRDDRRAQLFLIVDWNRYVPGLIDAGRGMVRDEPPARHLRCEGFSSFGNRIGMMQLYD